MSCECTEDMLQYIEEDVPINDRLYQGYSLICDCGGTNLRGLRYHHNRKVSRELTKQVLIEEWKNGKL